MIKVLATSLPGVLKIDRGAPFRDHRGTYETIYKKEEYRKNGIGVNFVEQDSSFSKIGVLRGLHGDEKTYKLVCCLFGSFYLVVVNYDNSSDFFGKWETFEVSAENGVQILIPPKHLNGHLILSNEGAIFHYNQSEYYSGASNQWSVAWNDPRFKIPWPIASPTLSERDMGLKT